MKKLLLVVVLLLVIAIPSYAGDSKKIIGALVAGYLIYEVAEHWNDHPRYNPPPQYCYPPPPQNHSPQYWYNEGYNDGWQDGREYQHRRENERQPVRYHYYQDRPHFMSPQPYRR